MVVVLVLHLFFVDDMIVFANSHKQSIQRFLGCLEDFEAVSSWLIETRVVLYCHGRHLSASQETGYLVRPHLLSFGGRITLLKFVLSSIPLYLLQIM